MSKKVLLVEDEDSIATALQYLIEREGYAVRRVDRPSAARRALADDRPDLVLLDIMLPESSGYGQCQEIRLDPDYSDVKILILSASGGPATRRKSLALGADAFVAKPFATGDFQAAIRDLMTEPAR